MERAGAFRTYSVTRSAVPKQHVFSSRPLKRKELLLNVITLEKLFKVHSSYQGGSPLLYDEKLYIVKEEKVMQ